MTARAMTDAQQRQLRNLQADPTLQLAVLAMLRRHAYLLTSAAIAITDEVARETAINAVHDARNIISKVEA